MSTSRQSLSRRVVVPFLVIVLTVCGLGFGGYQLVSMKFDSNSSTQTELPNLPDNGNGSSTSLPVNVYNATKTSGLARERADYLTSRNWTIKTIGNWSGSKISRSTIFYPKGFRAAALELSAVVVAQVVPATPDMATDSLTYVLKS